MCIRDRSTVLSPAVAYASDDAGSVKKIPHYEEIKDQLDENEVVTAKDYEIKVGDNFDVKNDYTGLTIQDDSKVKAVSYTQLDVYKRQVWEVYKFIHVNTVAPFGTFRTKIRKWKKIAL